jgi:hypothetical protein
MAKKYDHLYHKITNFTALHHATLKAVKGKRKKPGVASFLATMEKECLTLSDKLSNKTWQPGRYTEIHVLDPKPRMVSAAPFRDRVVHHALCHVINPLFEKTFIYDSYANRLKKGTHRAIDRYQHFARGCKHVLRCDIYRFFPSIDHEIIKQDLRWRLKCQDTLWLLDKIIDGSNKQETVNIYYSDDDLFTPFQRKRGLPIGNLTSQFFGNLYMNALDHYIKEVLRVKKYLRYVDDFALFHDDPNILQKWQNKISLFLEKRRLKLHPRKTYITETAKMAEFLGYLIWPEKRRLPEPNVKRFRDRLRRTRDQWRSGVISDEKVRQRINGWIGHAQKANSYNLRKAIFKGGWFDPTFEACSMLR